VRDRKGADVKESRNCEQGADDVVAAQKHMVVVGSKVDVVVMIDGAGGAAEECAWDLEAPTAAEDSIVPEVHVSMVVVGGRLLSLHLPLLKSGLFPF
jgi:hypothetical protein